MKGEMRVSHDGLPSRPIFEKSPAQGRGVGGAVFETADVTLLRNGRDSFLRASFRRQVLTRASLTLESTFYMKRRSL